MGLNIHNTFTDIASDERFIRDIKEVVVNKVLYENTSDFFVIVPGVKGGQQVAAMRGIEYITRKSTGCGGAALTPDFPALSQKWEPQLAEVKLKFCYTDFMQKFTQWGLANGYNIKNLEEAEFFLFIQDLIVEAMKLDMQRLVLFSDENIATQNILSDSSKAEFYDIVKKGLMPTLQYLKTIPELADNFVDIPQNTVANPYSALKAGISMEIMDKVTNTFDFDGDLLLMNASMYKNYSTSLKGFIMQGLESSKTEIQKGIPSLQYDGNTLVPVRNYDRWRKKDFSKPDGTIHLPHFMLFSRKEYLQVGIDDAAALDNLTMEYIGGDDEHFYIKGNYMLDFKIVNPYGLKAAF